MLAHQVSSSMIDSLSYDSNRLQLYVTFNNNCSKTNNRRYVYYNINCVTFYMLLFASSVGKCFWKLIRSDKSIKYNQIK